MAIGDTAQPTNGVPSLTDSEIVSLYQKWLGRGPDASELASERENALKYAAAGIENQIANRAGNTPASGVRGDEGQAPLTVPASQAGHVAALGPAAIVVNPDSYSSPAGLAAASPTLVAQPSGSTSFAPTTSTASVGGLSLPTILIGAVALGAAFYLWEHR